MSLQIIEAPNCCANTPIYQITFDCDYRGEKTYNVCKSCFKKPEWSTFTLKIIDLKIAKEVSV